MWSASSRVVSRLSRVQWCSLLRCRHISNSSNYPLQLGRKWGPLPAGFTGGLKYTVSQGVPTSSIHTSNALRGDLVPFNLPDVGEAIETVEVKEWLVKEGDVVKIGDEVCEVQSDKSAVTVYVPYDGVIRQLMYEVGGVATKGKPLIMVEVDGVSQDAQSSTAKEEAPPTPATPTTPEDLLTTPAVRKMAKENSVDLTQVKGSGKDGRILKEDLLSHLESGPRVSDVLSVSSEGVKGVKRRAGKVLATPAVRRIAGEEGVNLSEVEGTGEEGRVLKEDLLRHIEAMRAAPALVPVSTPVSTEDRVVPVKGFQAVMVKTMTASGQIPQFGYCDEIDMSRLVSLRPSFKAQLQDRGVRFSYMPVIIKAVSMALREFPMLNATVNAECTEVTYKADHNIGVAMHTPEGLVVPTIKQVQNKSVFEVAVELTRLQEAGAGGRLAPSDVAGGTFSLSNIGAIGGTYTRPMLLPPAVAIGAFGKIRQLPRFDASGSVYAAHVMEASWSADHRVIDGATVAQFSNLWRDLLEEPANMIVELR